MQQPAFEIHLGNRVIAIYADGRVDGLPGVSMIVVNRIPQLMAKAACGGARLSAFAAMNDENSSHAAH